MRYRLLPALCAGVCWLSLGAASSRADFTVTVASSQDSMIFQNNVNNSAGGAIDMFAGTNTAQSVRRALVEFDIAGKIPTGATIESVTLTLTYAMAAGSGGGGGGSAFYDIGLHRLLQSWGEGTTEFGQGPGGVGQGAPASNGDVTWNARFFGSQNWTTPGGDFVSTASAVTSVGGPTVDIPFTWSSSAMVSDVQQWLDTPTSNDGWMLLGQETGIQTFRGFYTKEESNPAFRPTLTVSYRLNPVPEPASAWMTACGLGIVLTAVRGRRGGRKSGPGRDSSASVA